MKISDIKVGSAQNIKPEFYNATVESVKNVLISNDYVDVKVEDLYQQKITVIIRYAYLMNVPGLPKRCTSAADIPDLIQKMASIEFFPGLVQVESIDRGATPELITGEILTFTFFKEVPENELLK